MPLTRSEAKKMKLDIEIGSGSFSGTGTEVVPTQNNGSNQGQPQNQIVTNSIYKNPDIIQRLGMVGSRAELLHLRQMSKDYYNRINPIYLNHVGKIMRIETSRLAGVVMMSGPQYIEILNNNWVEEEDGFRVTEENWTSKIAHIFRRLKLNDIWYMFNISDFELDGLSPKLIIQKISPYISILDFRSIPRPKDLKNLDQLHTFMKEFTNLKTLNINYFKLKYDQGFLDTILTAVKPGVLIKLSICEITNRKDYKNILAKYGSTSTSTNQMETNLTILLKVNSTKMFRVFAENYGALTNLKFHIDLSTNNLAELEDCTSLCLQYQDFIGKLDLELVIVGDPSEFQPQDEEGIKRCLVQLGPIVTKLINRTRFETSWNLLAPSTDMNWSKLTELNISGYEYPLEILKSTKKLQKLTLNISWINCIFHNASKSAKECLKEYFSNLCELQLLYLYGLRYPGLPPEPKSGEYDLNKDELKTLLVDVLPKNAVIKFHARPGKFDETFPRWKDIYARCKNCK